VSGTIKYEDGSLIPANSLTLTFIAISSPSRAGFAKVDAEGRFASAATRGAADGIVAGKHRVVVTGSMRRQLPANVLPPEYGDQERSPVEVDTTARPFEIRLRKPGKS